MHETISQGGNSNQKEEEGDKEEAQEAILTAFQSVENAIEAGNNATDGETVASQKVVINANVESV